MERPCVMLDGNSLTVEECIVLGKGNHAVNLTDLAWRSVDNSRAVVEQILQDGETIAYGINTGFGNFANVVIPKEKVDLLQLNLIRSHAAGVGNNLGLEATRRLMVARINVLAKGYSGISRITLQQVIDAFNADCLSLIPEQGTLGASGDLAQLAHLALGLIGEGQMWNPKSQKYEDAAEVLKQNGLKPLELKAKEGLALINGTQFISSLGMEALDRAINAAVSADFICALTVEALRGTINAFFPVIHEARPHPGQMYSAANVRSCLHSDQFPSEIWVKYEHQVQDAYSLRCTPQVHGIVHDTLHFVKNVLEVEVNSATDNPMVICARPGQPGWIVSGGNFHGEYPSKALDYLAIATAELGSISERRTDRLMNSHLSHLPEFLVHDGGLNSGFMIAHCTAAALVSENKGLAHPASVDSIPTSAQKEDHVSMGGWAARKALSVVTNIEIILGIELLAACQAMDLHRPLKTTAPLEAVYAKVREVVPFYDRDRYIKPDIDAATKLVRDGTIVKVIQSVVVGYREDSKMGYNCEASLKRMLNPQVYRGQHHNDVPGVPSLPTAKNLSVQNVAVQVPVVPNQEEKRVPAWMDYIGVLSMGVAFGIFGVLIVNRITRD